MPSKLFKSAEDEKLATLAIVHLRSRGILQSKIPDYLPNEISQPYVSKILSKAKSDGILDMRPTINMKNVKASDWERMKEHYFPQRNLGEKLDKWTPKGIRKPALHVYHSNSLEDFCSVASDALMDLLKFSTNVGILGGLTVFKLLDRYRAHISPRKGHNLNFTPLSGTCTYTIHQAKEQYATSPIAAAFNEMFSHRGYEEPSLTGVPAYISSSENLKAIKAYVQKIPGYLEIFGADEAPNKSCRINKLDTIITGIGTTSIKEDEKPKSTIGEFLRERLAQEGSDVLPVSSLSAISNGDIGGHLIEPTDKTLNRDQKSLLKKMNAGWTGLQSQHLSKTALRASKKKGPGVIVTAYEKSKAKAIRDAIKHGFTNTLIISSRLADELDGLED